MTALEELLGALQQGKVEYVVVGGVAAVAHGSARLTQDLDIVYARSPENIRRLASALAPYKPCLRGAPRGLPFRLDEPTLRDGMKFTLTTDLGDLDLLGEVSGGETYESLLPHTLTLDLGGLSFRCLDLDWLIRVKRAAGRRKDLEAVAELEALREERDKDGH
ncbi:MAG TPA: hypothetical protein VFB95_05930 [Candidatus Cryosericum sp.]|nr:hypothetical protein [Candidatus Cryosericum sp.]